MMRTTKGVGRSKKKKGAERELSSREECRGKERGADNLRIPNTFLAERERQEEGLQEKVKGRGRIPNIINTMRCFNYFSNYTQMIACTYKHHSNIHINCVLLFSSLN